MIILRSIAIKLTQSIKSAIKMVDTSLWDVSYKALYIISMQTYIKYQAIKCIDRFLLRNSSLVLLCTYIQQSETRYLFKSGLICSGTDGQGKTRYTHIRKKNTNVCSKVR